MSLERDENIGPNILIQRLSRYTVRHDGKSRNRSLFLPRLKLVSVLLSTDVRY